MKPKEIVKALREKQSRDNRELLDAAADMIESINLGDGEPRYCKRCGRLFFIPLGLRTFYCPRCGHPLPDIPTICANCVYCEKDGDNYLCYLEENADGRAVYEDDTCKHGVDRDFHFIRCKECIHYDAKNKKCKDNGRNVYSPDWHCSWGEYKE